MISQHAIEPLKRCPHCGIEKPLSGFTRDRQKRDGLHSSCRACRTPWKSSPAALEHRRAYFRDYRQAHLEEYRTRAAARRIKDPQRLLNVERASRARHIEERRIANRLYYVQHKAERNAYAAEWRRLNHDRLADAAKARFLLNPQRWVEDAALRRSRRRANGPVVRVDYDAILARDGLVCHICAGSVGRRDVHFDHVVPLARGGAHSADNIRVSHSLCNLRKGARIMERTSTR